MSLIDDYRNGKRYGTDWKAPTIQHMNDLVGTVSDDDLLVNSLAQEVDNTDANKVGNASLTIIGEGTNKKFKASNLKGETGNGITSIQKTGSNNLVDTYTITFTNGGTTTFNVNNGKGITTITKTSTTGLVDTYTITFNDGSSTTFTITNGNGINNIAKTSTNGLVDTYTITFDNNTSKTFTVTNGDTIEMRVSGGYFQYKYAHEDGWINLIATSSISNIDDELSESSTNAVQNNVITQALNNKLDKDNAWECILNQPLTTTAVNVVKFSNVLDFNNYDYKIEYETCSEGNFPSTAIRLRFLNNSNNVVTVDLNSWVRYHINTDYSASGTQESVINPITGYGFSKGNQTIIDWGVDGNDGSGAMLYSGEFTPVFDIYGNYSIIYKTSHIRSSYWCQQYFIYSGCVNFTSTFNGGVTGFSLTEDNGVNFKVGTNYIKIYRRQGGWNKYNGG